MNQYKVIGRKYFDYWTVVTAETKEAAIDIAMKDDIDWIEMETDDIIEATDITLVEDEDKVIDMSNGLVV